MLDLQTLQARVAAGESFEYLLFWGDTGKGEGRVGKECFSQWYPVEFEVDGIRYASAEHYMMAGKARLFDDAEVFAQIIVLLDTGDQVLVEAAPRDRIWGIGMGASNPNATTRASGAGRIGSASR